MNPLILIAARIFPGILASIASDSRGGVQKAVIKAVADAIGASDATDAEQKLQADPTLQQRIEASPQLQENLAAIALEQEKARLSAETDRIRLQNEAAKAHSEAALALGKQADEATAKLAEIDAANTAAAQAQLEELVAAKSPLAWAPAVLSIVVVAGFFFVLGAFLIFKQAIEAPPALTIPTGEAWTQLTDAQKAAVLRPPSDFAVQILNILIGTMAAGFSTVLSFWLGSSQGSRAKDLQLAAATATAQTAADEVAKARRTRDEAEAARNAAEKTRDEIAAAVPPPVAQQLIEENRLSAPAVQDLVSANRSAFAGAPGSGASLSFGSGGGALAPADFPEGGLVSPPPPPIAAGTLAAEVAELVKPHKHFPAGVGWALTRDGISVEGARAERTGGDPDTVTGIWKDFGPLCASAARDHGVPVELIVATIATESRGRPSARRPEPNLRPPDESVGLMQTLVRTARQETERPGLTATDLLDPATSIAAGTLYIANRRKKTHFDPPLVAASYNAGDLYSEDRAGNRWRLRCFPKGTGRHIDTFVAWFGDAMRVSAAADWSNGGTVPSFAFLLRGGGPGSGGGVGAGGGPDGGAADPGTGPAGGAAAATPPATAARQFPPLPDFPALTDDDERRQLFGTFRFRPDPQPNNKEHIHLLDNWEGENIVPVELPAFPGYRHDQISTRFHRRAADQLLALWREWQAEGLLGRIVTFDGAFEPRFQRRSTTRLSNHAWGTAFDINWEQNQLGQEPARPDTPGCVYDLVAAANRHGFYWGGHFRDRKDGMHFEIARLL